MNPKTLVVLYFVIGAGLALGVARRSVGSFVGTWLLWPLWLPFALDRDRTSTTQRVIEREIADAVATARAFAATTDHAFLFSEADARAVRESARRLARRLDSVESELARLRALQPESELRARQLERLLALRASDERALSEIRELLQLLVTELTLSHHAAAADPGPLLVELRARVEAMGAA